MDGALADTERDGHRVAFNQVFADAGLDWHWDVATVNDYTCNQDFSAAAVVLDQLDDPDFQLKTVVSIFTRQNEISDAVKEIF